MTKDEIFWLTIGIFAGWILKVPFLIRWYRKLKVTKEYKAAMKQKEYKDMVRRRKKMFKIPDVSFYKASFNGDDRA